MLDIYWQPLEVKYLGVHIVQDIEGRFYEAVCVRLVKRHNHGAVLSAMIMEDKALVSSYKGGPTAYISWLCSVQYMNMREAMRIIDLGYGWFLWWQQAARNLIKERKNG